MAANPAPDKSTPSRPGAWRTDIQGLRAVAVGLVVAAHVGFPYLGGGFIGVDVFFVLSGYLITTLLLREADRTGRVSIAQFYVRRARRILPAATLVIMAVLTFAAVRLPTTDVTDYAQDAGWAAFFLANVHFAQAGVDYFDQSTTSVFQHYWSLSVEEQFYIVWPLLALVVAARFGRRSFAVLAAVATVGSLAWSVHLTAAEPTAAYFSTPARAFELAAGALLACWRGRLPRPYALVSAVLGAGMILAGTLAFSDSSPFPGVDALVPVLGTVGLLAAGPETLVARVLSLSPMRYVGDISYSLYLWHWPLIVLTPHIVPSFGHDLMRKLVSVAIAFGLAALSHRFVEVPFQQRQVRLVSTGLRPLLLWPLGLSLAIGSGWASTAWAGHAQHQRQEAARAWFAAHTVSSGSPSSSPSDEDDRSIDVPGEIRAAVALARKGAPIPPSVDAATLKEDSWQVRYDDCYAGYGSTAVPSCTLGDARAKRTLAVVGDSHAGMWLPAFDELGKQRHLKVVPIVKLGCATYPVQQYSRNVTHAECDAFRRATTERLSQLRPDGVVVTARGELFMRPAGGRSVDEQWSAAVHDTARRLSRVSPRVNVVGDVPAYGSHPTTCLSAPEADERSCIRSPASLEASSNAVTQRAVEGTKARFVDVADLVCTAKHCPLVVGEKVTFFDDSHLTASWVRHVAPRLAEKLEPLVGRRPHRHR